MPVLEVRDGTAGPVSAVAVRRYAVAALVDQQLRFAAKVTGDPRAGIVIVAAAAVVPIGRA